MCHIYWLKKIVLFDLICIVLMMLQEDLNSSCNGIRIRLENAFTTCVWNQGSFQSTTLRRSYNELKKMFECNALQKLIFFFSLKNGHHCQIMDVFTKTDELPVLLKYI